MATLVSMKWREDGQYGAAVSAAVLPSLVPLPLLAVPMLTLAAAMTLSGAGRTASIVALVLSLVGLSTLAVRKARSPEYRSARAIWNELLNAPLANSWLRLRPAYDTLGWCRKTTTERKDPETGEVLGTDETVEYPATVLASGDYQDEVLVIIDTTSAIVSAPDIQAYAEKLASYLGFNGWVVEVTPIAPTQVQVRMSRHGSGGDIFGRKGIGRD